MPGSIQVSVLGLMDLASPPPLSSLSLTVSMGKREYRTVGGGELSFPVVSLRENIIVMIHDAEGEEILRAEFRTMLLLERGLWDNLFPIKNGGSLQMKLQFLLSEEDRNRIREMRDTALKRRCVEKPRTKHRRSFSDNRIGYSPTRRIVETVSEGMLLDHSELAKPIVEQPSSDQREKLPADIIGEEDSSNLNSSQTILKSFSVGNLPDISSEGKSKLLKEPFFLNKTQNAIAATHYETPGNKDFKCDEKINKLDSTAIKGVDPPRSVKFGSYVIVDNDYKTIGSEKSTSKRKDFASVNARKGPSILPIIWNFETVREKENLNLIRKGGSGLGSNVTSGTLKESFLAHGSTDITGKKQNTKILAGDGIKSSHEGVERKIDMMDVNERNNEEQNLRNRSGHEGPTSSGGVDRKTKNDDENENEDEILGEKSLPNEQGTSVEVAETVKNDENTLQSPSNEIVEALNLCYDWVCPIGILGVWTPRHLCVTTGSKLLREFAELYECSSMKEDYTKNDGDVCLQDNECKVLSSSGNSSIENSPSSLESNVGLIEQGVWICVIIVACGLLRKV